MHHKRAFFFTLALFSGVASNATSAPPPEQFLPNTTCAAVMTTDGAAFVKVWEKTQFAALANDPLLQPLIQDLDAQWRRGQVLFGTLGLNWEDIKAMASGPAAVAILRPQPDQVALLGVIETTGKERARNAVVAKLAGNALRKGGRAKQQMVLNEPITVLSVPAPQVSKWVTICIYTRNNLLMLADDPAAVEAVLARWERGHDSLMDVKAYQETRRRSAFPDGKPVHLSWFVDPYSTVKAIRLMPPAVEAKRGDMLTVLGEEGFTAVQAVGGATRFDEGTFDQLSRSAVYAPPPHTRALAALNFPNQSLAGPAPWLPADVGRCLTFSWDSRDLLTAIGCLFDRLSGKPGDFIAVVDALRDDKEGPQVDVRKEILGRLTGQVTVVSDCPAAIPERGEGKLLALEARDEKPLAAAIGRLLAGEESVRPRDLRGQPSWEIRLRAKKQQDGSTMEAPHLYIAVNGGRLLVADHPALLEKVLAAAGEPLVTQADFAAVDAQLKKLAPGPISFRYFSRPPTQQRGIYELAKTNRLNQAGTLSAHLLSEWLQASGIKLDAAKMPPFEKVAHHLQPIGALATTVPEGWDVIAFSLKGTTK